MRVGGTKLHESISAKNYIDTPRRRERMSADSVTRERPWASAQ